MPSFVIAGASRGLGYGFLTHLASNPNNTVVGLIRNRATVEAKLASDNITNVHLLVADITNATALAAAAKEAAAITGGKLDVLINNAAYFANDITKVHQYDPEKFEAELNASIAANVTGVQFTINAFLPLLHSGSKVLTLSTGMADMDLVNKYEVDNGVAYAISKAATNMLIAKYNASLGKKENILFFSISPGYVDTSAGRAPMTEEELASAMEMGTKFAKYAPHFTGPISVEDSVEAQLAILEKATVETHGGAFISHLGNKQWL